MKTAYYDSPVGLLKITEADNHIIGLSLARGESDANSDSSPLLSEAIKQLKEYFAGERFDFDLPVKQQGTDFQKKAWDYLSTIPYGTTVSYKNEAEAIGSAKASRAVGSANGCNNIAIIVPCHRVINANNKLGGYAYGLEMKEYLLNMEKNFRKDRG